MNEVRPGARDLIVDLPSASKLARTTLSGSLECEQGDDVARVGVEDLLVGGVGRAADGLLLRRRGQVLDVRQHDVGRPPVELGVLAAPQRRDVRRDPHVRDHVLLARVLVDAQAPEHEEPVSVV